MALLMLIAAVCMPVPAKLTFVMHDSTADNRTEKWFKVLYEKEDGAKKEIYKSVLLY